MSEGSQPENEQNRQTEAPRGMSAVAKHILEHKMDAALWTTRIISLMYGFLFIVPIFSPSEVSYSKVLLSNAATSALRLQQRVRGVTFTREFLMQILAEDSFHYLLYSMNFLPCAPMSLVVMPIILFALLHFANFTLYLCDIAGSNNLLSIRFAVSFVEVQQRNILRLAAMIEIFLMPVVILNIILGRVNLITPFLYYKFVTLRYLSRRNPYTRAMFHELRLAAEQAALKPFVPDVARNAIHWSIAKLSAMAPPVPQ